MAIPPDSDITKSFGTIPQAQLDDDHSIQIHRPGGGSPMASLADLRTYMAENFVDPEIVALASVTAAADKVPYFTSGTEATVADFTATGRSIVGAASAAAAATAIGVGTGDSPQVTAVNLGHATDTTLTRVSAGVVAIEGVTVVTETATQTLTNKTLTSAVVGTGLEVGHATDTTLTRSAAGKVAVEGKAVPLMDGAVDLVIAGPTVTRTLTIPDADGTAVTLAATQTLTNKTLTSAVVDTGLEVGHATDTTLTRSAAGKIAIEGKAVPLMSGAVNAVFSGPTATRTYAFPDTNGTVLLTTSVPVVQEASQAVLASEFTDGGGTVGTLILGVTVPLGAVLLGSKVTVDGGFAGDTTCTLTIGDGSDADRYMTGTPSIFATAANGIQTGEPSGNRLITSANTPTLTITSSTDISLVIAEAGSMTVKLYYIATV